MNFQFNQQVKIKLKSNSGCKIVGNKMKFQKIDFVEQNSYRNT